MFVNITISRLPGGPVSPRQHQLQERQHWLRGPPLGEEERMRGGEDQLNSFNIKITDWTIY